MCDVENCLFLQQLKKGEQDMEENVGQKDKEKVEEEMIEQAFQQLLNDYLATKHRKRIEIITKAFNFANQAHKGIKRRSGEPYIMHPLAVAQIVCNEIGLGSTSICAALLHDVVEDTDYTVEDIENIFGPKIAQIVDGLTKISGGIFGDRASAQAENFKKLLLTMSDDIRVILIKIADRLHNMRTLGSMLPNKQFKIAGETLYIYAPLANRLGLYKIKTELENLSFKYEHPEEYQEIEEKLAATATERDKVFNDFTTPIRAQLDKMGLKFRILARVKSIYSIWNKMQTKHVPFEEIYDLLAVRIIFEPRNADEELNDCFDIYVSISKIYKPHPDRLRDWVSHPKANGYQALHVTLMGNNGQWIEVQIRSERMNDVAEQGFAAHWKYKEGGSGKNDNEEQKLSWLRQILEWQTDTTDNKEFMNAIKTDLDLFSDQVYVFTPAGDVKNLPAGSTPIDFAYSIHTAVGNKLIGARVNGRQVPIETELHNGDRVEIITSQNSKGPSMDWLSVVKSSQAKTKINQWFRQENKTDNIQRGKDAMAAYCKTKGIVLSNLLQPELQEKVMKKYNFLTWDAVLASIGHGGLKEGQVVNRLQEEYKKEEAKKITEEQIVDKINTPGRGESHKHAKGGIVVKGMDDVAVRFSRCCAPVPGDEIVGYITRGRGVSIHRTDCVNVLCMDEFDRKRLIEAEWSEDLLQNQKMYMTEINIYANDSKGLVFSLSKIFNEENINLTGMNVRVNKQGKATVSVKFEIRSKEQLNKLIAKIRNVEGIIDIERTTG